MGLHIVCSHNVFQLILVIYFTDVNTIVKFATLSNKHNHSDYAHALLEQVLTSYPKRVDIWTTYVDMLVKANEIVLARYVRL